jgi:uracil-DNA glycosylase family 4
MAAPFDPGRECARCPRLKSFRDAQRIAEPHWHNAPVDTLLTPQGAQNVRLLVVGLAPGLKGANRTGRPFTGDFAGELLFSTLLKFGFANGNYGASAGDGLRLAGAAITNAVRCVPPQNKPTGIEIAQCRPHLAATLSRFPRLAAILALGRIAHDSTLRALGRKPALAPFAHGAVHEAGGIALIASYHCSRYNTNTGRLTEAMFHEAFAKAAAAARH